ncbi:MAG: condensin subunit ScpB [Bryobacterales bacterium]|nr:condensin subunit ScpB [Bryobacterales bacterium]
MQEMEVEREQAQQVQAEQELPQEEAAAEPVSAEELLPPGGQPPPSETDDTKLRATIEAIVYLTDQPLSVEQLAAALGQTRERVGKLLGELTAEYEHPEHGIAIREVAGGFSMATKAEHHDEVRAFVKNLQPPMKLSLASLETLAVIAYKQPITSPEIMEIRGVQGASVLKTLLDRKLIAAAGRKNVVGKPILYKTTREFLVQFGLKDLNELPSLKEFEEIRRMSIPEDAILPLAGPTGPVVGEPAVAEPTAPDQPVAEPPVTEPAATEPEPPQDEPSDAT